VQHGDDYASDVETLPDGRVRIRVTYLEMREKPTEVVAPPDDRPVAILHLRQPTLSYYRYLYETVGRPWGWTTRDEQSDEQVLEIIQHPDTEIHVLHVDGVPAGFAELDFRGRPDVELIFLGMVPEFIGQRWGPVLLSHAVEAAWACRPERFWLHTCNLDHPKAVAVYERAGFVQYKEAFKVRDDPRKVMT
jgi:GNAT superfamily N-acetyltransferase